MSDWSDTPPTVAGTYWVKYGRGGREVVAVFDAEEWFEVGEFGSSCRPDEATELVQFGHRIPTNAELGELPGLIEEYAVACRLHELAQLHDEQARFTAGFRQPAIGHATAQARSERCRELLAKINAILGVPNDA